jgi:hypothetical protein
MRNEELKRIDAVRVSHSKLFIPHSSFNPAMLPDNLSGDGTNLDEGENAGITENKHFPTNEKLEREKQYRQDQSNNKASADPTAARHTGAKGYTQRGNQKDQLENLHIHGDDTHPGGGNDHQNAGEQAQGPGFEAEGSIELDHKLRTREQQFGEKAPGGSAQAPNNGEASS